MKFLYLIIDNKSNPNEDNKELAVNTSRGS